MPNLILDPATKELVDSIFKSIDDDRDNVAAMFEADPTYPAEYARGQMFAFSQAKATISTLLENRYGSSNDN